MLKSMILDFLDAQPTPDWVPLTQFLKDCGYSDLTEIRSALMQMENDKLIQFRPGSFHKKLGLHERINPNDYKNSYVTLDNIPLLDAKITDEGSQKVREEKAAAGRRRFTAQQDAEAMTVPAQSPQPFQPMRQKKDGWDLDNHDKLKIIQVTEESLLDIVATSNGPFEPAPILRDESVPIQNRGKIMATLMLLKNKGLVKPDDFGLKWFITWKGKLDRFYRYKGWAALGVLAAIIFGIVAYLAWVHPFASGESTPKPAHVDTIQRPQTNKAGRHLPDSSTIQKAGVDTIKKGGAK